MEPVQNSGGCIVPPDGYYQRIRELCDQHGILLIMDEVICGFGRTGKMFGTESFEHPAGHHHRREGADLGVRPARRGNRAAGGRGCLRRATRTTKFQHGITFGGIPVAAAAALANLDIIERERLPERAHEMGEYLKSMLGAAIGQHPNVGEIRGRGLFIGIELVRDRESRSHARRQGAARLGLGHDERQGPDLPRGRPARQVIQLSPPSIERRPRPHLPILTTRWTRCGHLTIDG